MSAAWLSILTCPRCGGGFRFDETPPPALGAAEFGILRCACGRFPVVDGIPIVQSGAVGMFEHTTGAVEVPGVLAAELVRLIEAGHLLAALLEALAIPGLPPGLLRRVPARLAGSTQQLARWLGKRQLRRQVLVGRAGSGARDVLGFYFRPGSHLGAEIGYYFSRRFGQPRHLAALALLAALPGSDKPVLDVACGLGHLDHYLTQRSDAVGTIGVDMNFFQLWIARHWMAPAGRFVCANAQDGLPFASDAFSATVCSDAYHYIGNRRKLQQEIERCAPGRPVLLTRVGNGAQMPNEGRELGIPGYLEEFESRDVRAFDEESLLRAYLARRNPFAERAGDPRDLAGSKWLSFAWNVSPLSSASWDTWGWPHAVGQLGLNPIYRVAEEKNGHLRLEFDFPSIWYAYENHRMLSYHPQTVSIARAQLENLDRWPGDPALAALVASFVLIGLPPRFVAGGEVAGTS